MRRLLPLLYPLTSLAVLILIWDQAVRWLGISDYLLPPPLAVYQALAKGFADGTLWPHIAATVIETLSGYVIGSLLAIILGAVLAESRTFERFVYPLLIGPRATFGVIRLRHDLEDRARDPGVFLPAVRQHRQRHPPRRP